jgi:hypothetical protein
VEQERHACEKALLDAETEAEEAYHRVYKAEEQMRQADLRIGKTRRIIWKSGFGCVLSSSTCKVQLLVVEIRSRF